MTGRGKQLALVPSLAARELAGVTFLRCDLRDPTVFAQLEERFPLIVADPAWGYRDATPSRDVENHYRTNGTGCGWIADALAAAHQVAARDARLVVWHTWPTLEEWTTARLALGERWPWSGVLSGGAWTKWNHPANPGAPGVGYEWTGDSEPVLIYRTGRPHRDRTQLCRNAHVSPRHRHSEKPVDWARSWIRRWTSPGDPILDVFSGLAPMARACVAEGRRYVGLEFDADRIRDAKARLAQYVTREGL